MATDSYLSDINNALALPAPQSSSPAPAPAPDPFAADINRALAGGAPPGPAMSFSMPDQPGVPPQTGAVPQPRGAVAMGEGLIDALTAGAQGTSPVVQAAQGQSNYQLAPDQDQWVFRESGDVPNQQTQVALRNPQTGEYQVYQRNPEMAESAPTALGRVLAYGTPEAGIPRVASAPAITAPQAMLQDFARTDVAPSIPAVAQGPASGYAASIMSKLPGFSGPITRGAQNMVRQTGASADRFASGMGTAEDAEQAGNVVQNAVGNFAKGPSPAGMTAADIIAAPTRSSSFGAKSEALYDRFWSQMNPTTQVPLPNTLAALQGPAARFPTIPQLGQQITNPKLQSLFQTVSQAGGRLTVPELQEFRSYIGRQLGSPVLVNDIPRVDLSRVYAGMSQDLESAAAAQAAYNKTVALGAGMKPADPLASFQAANSYYSAGKARIDQLEPLLNGSPERTFAQINRAAGQGPAANAGLLRSLQRSMPDQDWGDVGAAVLRKMGAPTAGTKEIVGGADFSPASFVTNWNKLSDAAKDTLFGAQGSSGRDNIEALTRVAGAQKNMTKFANPSGTGHMGATVAEGGLALTAVENRDAFLAHPILTTLALAGGYAAPRLLMSPAAARWLYAVPATINRAPTASAGIEKALGNLDVIARGDPGLVPAAAQLRQSLSQIAVPAGGVVQ